MDISTTCCTPIPRPTRSTLPTTATSQRSSKLGCVGAGIMDASEGTDERAGLFLKLAAQGCEIVEPPRIGITASRSRPAIPARGGASTHPTTGVPTRRGRTASPIWWRCLPGWTSSDAVTAGPSPTLGRSRCDEQLRAWTHAAVQTPQGTWLSNIGAGSVIEHDNPEALTGGVGNPTTWACCRAILRVQGRPFTLTERPMAFCVARTCDVPWKYQGRLGSTPNCHPWAGLAHRLTNFKVLKSPTLLNIFRESVSGLGQP